AGYLNLELDLESGVRSSRQVAIRDWVCRLTGAESATAVNNNAAATVIVLRALCQGKEVVISRGQLIEIGGSFRIPEIMAVSGALLDFGRFGFTGEPVARQSIAAGADLVLFSGDKLLGGPQAGIIAGKKEWIQKIEKDPLMRAFRLDKMTLAALETTLRLYLNEERALRDVPGLQMLGVPLSELRQRAEALAVKLRALDGVA